MKSPSFSILFQLLTDIRENIGCLFTLCEIIAELDVLVSFAQVSSAKNFAKPNFGLHLDLKKSRHPILDCTQNYDNETVPNDVVSPNQTGIPLKNKHFNISFTCPVG